MVCQWSIQSQFRDSHSEHVSAPVRIHEQCRRGDSVFQQVAGGSSVAEARPSHGLCGRVPRHNLYKHISAFHTAVFLTSSWIGKTRLVNSGTVCLYRLPPPSSSSGLCLALFLIGFHCQRGLQTDGTHLPGAGGLEGMFGPLRLHCLP